MKLKPCEKCYTDVCIDGKWYHHDHLTDKAYMLKGGMDHVVELARTPTTEDELLELLNHSIQLK
ncbi:MAG: hypothetical protein ACK5NC_15200 [Vibrio sp.]